MTKTNEETPEYVLKVKFPETERILAPTSKRLEFSHSPIDDPKTLKTFAHLACGIGV